MYVDVLPAGESHGGRLIDSCTDCESHGYDVEWHFFEGANGLDLDPALTDALDDAHIPHFIHLA